MMNELENFIYQYENEQRSIMLYLHNLFTDELGLFEKMRFKIPFYFQKSWICYLNPLKNEGIECCFLRANELAKNDLLDFKERKQVAGITIYKVKEIPETELKIILQEAILLDEQVPYQSKRTAKKQK